MKRLLVLIVLFSFLVPLQAFGHSGRTDSSGCHNDRKRGGYHCHNRPVKRTEKRIEKPRPNLQNTHKIMQVRREDGSTEWAVFIIDPKGNIIYQIPIPEDISKSFVIEKEN